MAAITVEAKTFNNPADFEWVFWSRQKRWFKHFPKRSVFGSVLNDCFAA
jgi:hypothetical protein